MCVTFQLYMHDVFAICRFSWWTYVLLDSYWGICLSTSICGTHRYAHQILTCVCTCYCLNVIYNYDRWHMLLGMFVLDLRLKVQQPWLQCLPSLLFPQKAIVLLSYRWYAYKKLRWHYFLFDFCYFTNFFILIYLWLPLGDSIRGLLFPIIFGFSNGPVLSAIVLWTNSVVPHSIDKMTSLFIHLSPSLALWGIRWWVYSVWMIVHVVYVGVCGAWIMYTYVGGEWIWLSTVRL